MKDILKDSAWPHTSLHAHEAVANMGWNFLWHPAHSPDLAPSDYYLFGPFKDGLHGHHFEDDSESEQSFCDVLVSRDREFYNIGVHCLTECWQKCVEYARDLVEK
jgi:hypothetical protein